MGQPVVIVSGETGPDPATEVAAHEAAVNANASEEAATVSTESAAVSVAGAEVSENAAGQSTEAADTSMEAAAISVGGAASVAAMVEALRDLPERMALAMRHPPEPQVPVGGPQTATEERKPVERKPDTRPTDTHWYTRKRGGSK